MNPKQQPLFTDADWTPESIDEVTKAIKEIADTELGLSYYPMQIRIITSEQMLDAYASNGMPVGYYHWSFGKHFLQHARSYKAGMGLAYEIVINTDPCLVFCMEDNTMTMQALVIAHAGFGHNAFFKNNYLFKQWTHPDSILDYLEFAKNYIRECEEKYGANEVATLIDACHALRMYGVDRYKRPPPVSAKAEKERMHARIEEIERNLSVLWKPPHPLEEVSEKEKQFPAEPQENMLYFIEKHAPSLPPWKREVIRIVRKIAQYFYPQMYTQVMNEGFACFTHYYVMARLYEKGLITDGAYQEFLHSHTNVVFQPDFDATVNVQVGKDDEGKPIIKKKSIYSGINVYALGFNMFMDIKRICEHPTEEDKKWFPYLAGTPWLPAIKNAVENFKDESFILQYLSPHLIRRFGFFALLDDENEDEYHVTAIHDDEGYKYIREKLAGQYERGLAIPDICVEKVNVRSDRMLVLRHTMRNRKFLDATDTNQMLGYIRLLWEYPVSLSTVDPSDGSTVEAWQLVGDDVEYLEVPVIE